MGRELVVGMMCLRGHSPIGGIENGAQAEATRIRQSGPNRLGLSLALAEGYLE